MKKRVLLALTSALLLTSCGAKPEQSSIISEIDSFSSSEFIEDSSQTSGSSNQDEGLDDIFLVLKDKLTPFAKSDKNGFRITQMNDDPLFSLGFQTDSDIFSSNNNQSSSSIGSSEIKEYAIEVDCEEALIESFNRTKKKGYCNRMTLKNAGIGIAVDGESSFNLKQTLVSYLAQTEIVGTSPKEYENGFYINLSSAVMLRFLIASLFKKTTIPSKNYINADPLYETIEGFFPMSTTMKTVLSSVIDFLKEEARSGVLSVRTETEANIEKYKIHRGIDNKASFRETIDDIVDHVFESAEINEGKEAITEIIDELFDKINSISGAFEINFTEESFEDIVLDFDIGLNDVVSQNDEEDAYFSLNSLAFSSRITLIDPLDLDFQTYPTNLQDHNVWEELSF